AIGGDGSVVERMRLEVRLDEATDFAAWSHYPVAVSERRSLNRFAAWVRRADGKTETVGREGFRTGHAGQEGGGSSSWELRGGAWGPRRRRPAPCGGWSRSRSTPHTSGRARSRWARPPPSRG